MQDYIAEFEKARAWTDQQCPPEANHHFEVAPEKAVDLGALAEAIASDLQGFLPGPDILAGHCFQVVREVSYILCERGVRHALTIGDVEYENGERYAHVTRQKLERDLAAGYQIEESDDGTLVGKPVDAHAWITLENGKIIDATILASMNAKGLWGTKSGALSFQDAIFYTGKPDAPRVSHIPYLTGFGFHARVLIHPADPTTEVYLQWFHDYPIYMSRINALET